MAKAVLRKFSEISCYGEDHIETVKHLIGLGADPNSRGQLERTPLFRECSEAIWIAKEILNDWDMSLAETLLSTIESEKEKLREKERARREKERNDVDIQLEEAQKEYEAHQKTLNAIYRELNKRIEEHDTVPAMGLDKGDITLQAIKDAEDQLEVAKVDYSNSKEKIRILRLKQQEKMEWSIGNSMTVFNDIGVTSSHDNLKVIN